MFDIDDNCVVVRRSELLATDLDDETIVINIEKGSYFGMSNIAQRIWKLIEKPQQVGTLIVLLADEYQVAPDICGDDIREFVSELLSEGLAVTVSSH